MIKRSVCATTLLVSLLWAAPGFAGGEVKAGTYASKGTNLDGSSYAGTATIAITSDTTCTIEWKSGDKPTSGICMRDADSFTAAYKMGSAVGLAIYKIGEDGTLTGVWTIAGESGAGTEILTPQ